MKHKIVYEFRYEYYKSSYGQSSWQTMTMFRGELIWDGTKPFQEMLKEAHPECFLQARDTESGDRNHHFLITAVKMGGPKSWVTLSIKQEKIMVLGDVPIEV